MRLNVAFLTPLTIKHETEHEPYRAFFQLTYQDGMTVKGEHMDATLQSGTDTSAQVTWTDAAGDPAKVDGATQWTSSDESLVTIKVEGNDSTIAVLHSVGPSGLVVIQASADADMGQGVARITAVLNLTVIAGEATGGTITLSPVAVTPLPGSPKPPTTPPATPRK